MLNSAMTWWKEQMRDLVPASLRPLGRTWRKVLVVTTETIDTPELELRLQGRGGHTSLGRHTLGSSLQQALARIPNSLRRAAVLQLPAHLLLQRHVILPLAAELDLAGVVAHEMDRLTPFRAEEVLWDQAIERRDTKRGQIHVRVTIVPRLQVQPLLDALRQAGLAPTRIQAAGAGQQRSITIGGPKRARAGRRALAWLQSGTGVLAAAAVALPFILQAVAQDNIEARIAAMRPQVTEAEKLRKAIASGATTADVIGAARNQVGNPLRSVALLTEMLPDDTYLTLLTITQRKLSITGRSASAARLIGALAANPALRNPAFAAPVVRDETSGGEMFSIRVELGT